MGKRREKWFSAVASNNLATIDEMLEKGFDANTPDERGKSALKRIAEKLYLAILDMKWDKEDLLKEIAATLIIHGANPEDLGHKGGEACDIIHAITLHIIKTAAMKGKTGPINELIEDGEIWFREENPAAKEQFLAAVRNKDIFSIEKMYEYEVIGFPPTQ
jgi:hypothetical protein